MSTGKYIVDLTSYDDTGSTNDPTMSVFRWRRELDVTVAAPTVQTLTLGAGTTTTVSLPSSPQRWLYVETDQNLGVRLSGDVTNNNLVVPSAAGTKDGVLFKRGTFTSLVLNVPGATAANVTVFTAY